MEIGEMKTYATDSGRAWSIAILLFLLSVVNFVDKLVLGISAVPIMKEFGLSPSVFGVLGSSFFALYAISGILTGLFIVNRVAPKMLLVALVIIWALAQLPIILGGSLACLFAGRLLLGIGEGPCTPTAYHALYGWFSPGKRNLPTSLLVAGFGIGFLAGAPILEAIIKTHGWRAAFTFCFIICVVWLILWLIFGADGPLVGRKESEATGPTIPWRKFWSDRTVIANIILATCCYWLVGISITWLAPYLQLGLGYSGKETGWLVSLILGSQIIVQTCLSFGSHYLLNHGHSSRLSRGTVNAVAVTLAGVALVAATLITQPELRIALLVLAFSMPQVTFVLGPAIVGEIAPSHQRGTALLITYTVITVGGLFSPIVTGWIIQAAGHARLIGYAHGFWLTGAILIAGGLWGIPHLNPEATRARFGRVTKTLFPEGNA